MIFYENGDVLKALRSGDLDAVAHGVNCSGGFGSGIAKQIKEEFPEVREAYIRDFDRGALKLGRIFPVKVLEDKYIINCATQQYYGRDPSSQPNGRYCDYDAIRTVMKKLHDIRDGIRIGMPMIGCGLAGGDWSVVEAIINEEFGNKPVYVYRL